MLTYPLKSRRRHQHLRKAVTRKIRTDYKLTMECPHFLDFIRECECENIRNKKHMHVSQTNLGWMRKFPYFISLKYTKARLFRDITFPYTYLRKDNKFSSPLLLSTFINIPHTPQLYTMWNERFAIVHYNYKVQTFSIIRLLFWHYCQSVLKPVFCLLCVKVDVN
jgi:hypothetical protein